MVTELWNPILVSLFSNLGSLFREPAGTCHGFPPRPRPAWRPAGGKEVLHALLQALQLLQFLVALFSCMLAKDQRLFFSFPHKFRRMAP